MIERPLEQYPDIAKHYTDPDARKEQLFVMIAQQIYDLKEEMKQLRIMLKDRFDTK